MNEQNTETGRAPRTPSITEFPEIAAPVPSTTHRQATSRVFDCDLLMPPPSLSSRPRYGGPHAGPQRISHAFQDLEDQKSGQSPPAGPVFGDQFNHRGPMPIQHMSHNVDHMMQTAPDPIPQPPMMMMAMNPTASIASDNDSDEEGKDSQESGLESSAHSSESMNNKLRDLPKADHPDVMDYLITLPKDVLQKALDSHSQSSPDAPNDNSTSGSKAKTECVTCAKTFNRPCELRYASSHQTTHPHCEVGGLSLTIFTGSIARDTKSLTGVLGTNAIEPLAARMTGSDTRPTNMVKSRHGTAAIAVPSSSIVGRISKTTFRKHIASPTVPCSRGISRRADGVCTARTASGAGSARTCAA